MRLDDIFEDKASVGDKCRKFNLALPAGKSEGPPLLHQTGSLTHVQIGS